MDYKRVLLRVTACALAICALTLSGRPPSVQADTIEVNLTFDLKDSKTSSSAWSTPFISFPKVHPVAGDSLRISIRFVDQATNQPQRLKVSDLGIGDVVEQTFGRADGDPSLLLDALHLNTFTYHDVVGDILSNPVSVFVDSGGSGIGANAFSNLTNTAFSFTGITWQIDFSELTYLSGDGFNQTVFAVGGDQVEVVQNISAQAQFTQQGPKLVGTGAVGEATQGFSVSLSQDGNTAIVGGNFDNNTTGAAWVFTRSGGVWTQQGPKLVATDTIEPFRAQQGISVSLSADGNTAIVGGPGDNLLTGAAWVYARSGDVWSQQAKLVAAVPVSPDGPAQGYSVALSGDGNTAILGGPADSRGVGAAWVFRQLGGVWSEQAKLVATTAVGAPFQGVVVSLSDDGNTAIVGGHKDNNSAGAAWVFTRSGGMWTEQAKLVGSDTAGPDPAQQGFSVSLSGDGNTAIVGGISDDSGTGAAWVFTRSGGVWTQQGPKLTATDTIGPFPSNQGYSVSLSDDGNVAIVGGRADNGYIGAAWLYMRSGGVWSQHEKLVGTGAVGTSAQGFYVSLSGDGNTTIIGRPGDNNFVGAAWVFARPVLANDSTPPVIVPQIAGTVGNNGWYRSDVALSWSVSDPESGVTSSSGCTTTTLTADTAGTTITCSAINGAGLSQSVPVTIKIDKTPPAIFGLPAAGCTQWPPNHKLVTVATVTVQDALSGIAAGSFDVTGTSSEPIDPKSPDIVITPNVTGGFVVQLRADRLGKQTGRVYTITASANDVAGNLVKASTTCTVPHEREK